MSAVDERSEIVIDDGPSPVIAGSACRVQEPVSPDEHLLDALQLNLVPGVGPKVREALGASFGSMADVLSASRDQLLQVPGVGRKLAEAIVRANHSEDAQRELHRCRELGLKLYRRGAADYPRMLSETHDPPSVLYCRGALEPRDELAVAIVGSRRCTHYGRQQSEHFSAALARAGITIVSGLARGVDAAAHRAAVAAGGRTIAVLANGLGSIYPPEHRQLADEIVPCGAVLSEFSLDTEPKPGHFPQRNRIISGLSLGVIIIEASRRSGALHTARHAMEQGREVFAVPGRIDSLASEGCHDLIRDGVQLIRNVDDVLESLGPLMGPLQTGDHEQIHSPRELTLSDQERQILNLLSSEPQHVDEILQNCPLESSRVLATLTVLEMKRMVQRLPGGNFVRAAH